MAYQDPFAALADMPGDAGDAARDLAANPSTPLETPNMTAQRVAGEQQQQQQVWKTLQTIKAQDLQTAQIPSYKDTTGTVQPVTDSSGMPVTDYDRKNNLGYDSAGNPVQVKPQVNAPPVVEDAFSGIGTTTDQKTGDQYKIRAGAPWQWTGQDQDIVQQNLDKEKNAAVAQASTSLGRKLTIDEHQFSHDSVDHQHQAKALASQFGLDGSEDLPTAQQKVSDSFNNAQDGYASPQANETDGWFPGSGNLTPAAQALRAQIDQNKAAALAKLSDLSATKQDLDTRKAGLDALQARREALVQMQLNTANQRLSNAGVTLPGDENVSTGSNSTATSADEPPLPPNNVPGVQNQSASGAADLSGVPRGIPSQMEGATSPDAATAEEAKREAIRRGVFEEGQTPEETVRALRGSDLTNASPGLRQAVASSVAMPGVSSPSAQGGGTVAQAIQDAALGKKPYTITDEGGLKLSETQPLDSIKQAVADGLLPQPPQEVMIAAAKQQKLIADAGSHPEIKAALAGAGRGAAFLAGAPVGAGIGAAALSETGIGAPVGGLVGGLITGSLASYGYGKLVEELAKHSETINSFVASQQLHPGYSAAGEFAAFGAGLPKAAMRGIGALASAGADTLAESSQVAGTTADAVRATISQANAAAKAAEAATGGTATVLKEATPDIYSRASNIVDAIGKAYSSSGGGLLDTIKNLSELASTAAAQKGPGFAAAQVAKRIGISAAGMVAIDTTLKEGSKALGLSDEGQTWGGVGQAALLGAFAAGHGIEAKGYDNNDVGDIILRGMAHDVTGTDPSQKVDMARLVSTPDINSKSTNISDRMTQPLTPEEQEIYSAFNQKASQLINEGKLPADPGQWQAKAKQILFAGRTGGIANVEIGTKGAPEETGGAPAAPKTPTPQVGPASTPPEKTEPVADQLAKAETQPSPVETPETLNAEKSAITRAGAPTPELKQRLAQIDAKLANLPAAPTATPAGETTTTPAEAQGTSSPAAGADSGGQAGGTSESSTPAVKAVEAPKELSDRGLLYDREAKYGAEPVVPGVVRKEVPSTKESRAHAEALIPTLKTGDKLVSGYGEKVRVERQGNDIAFVVDGGKNDGQVAAITSKNADQHGNALPGWKFDAGMRHTVETSRIIRASLETVARPLPVRERHALEQRAASAVSAMPEEKRPVAQRKLDQITLAHAQLRKEAGNARTDADRAKVQAQMIAQEDKLRALAGEKPGIPKTEPQKQKPAPENAQSKEQNDNPTTTGETPKEPSAAVQPAANEGAPVKAPEQPPTGKPAANGPVKTPKAADPGRTEKLGALIGATHQGSGAKWAFEKTPSGRAASTNTLTGTILYDQATLEKQADSVAKAGGDRDSYIKAVSSEEDAHYRGIEAGRGQDWTHNGKQYSIQSRIWAEAPAEVKKALLSTYGPENITAGDFATAGAELEARIYQRYKGQPITEATAPMHAEDAAKLAGAIDNWNAPAWLEVHLARMDRINTAADAGDTSHVGSSVKLTPSQQLIKDALGDLLGSRPVIDETVYHSTAHPGNLESEGIERTAATPGAVGIFTSPDKEAATGWGGPEAKVRKMRVQLFKPFDVRDIPLDKEFTKEQLASMLASKGLPVTAADIPGDQTKLPFDEWKPEIEALTPKMRDAGFDGYVTKTTADDKEFTEHVPFSPKSLTEELGARPIYDAPLPKERMPVFIEMAQKLAEYVDSPAGLARDLQALGPKAPQYSQSLWHALKMVGAKGAAEPDWSKEYAKLEQPATPAPAAHEFSSTQVNMPSPIAKEMREWAKANIPDSILADDGREEEPHITALFGLHADAPDEVREAVKDFGPISAKLGKISVFKNDKYDVVKVGIQSPDLHRLNKALGKLEHTTDFPDYQPHATLAYVKPGEGAQFAGRDDFAGKDVSFDSLVFSDKKRKHFELPLQEKPKTAAELSDTVAATLSAGGSIDRRALTKLGSETGLSPKAIDEAAELGIVKAARTIVGKSGDHARTFDALVDLYDRQPNLTAKTSTSKINQAYSTPAPMAWVADVLAKVGTAKSIGEPTAGNGMLLIGADLSKVQANEIDPTRHAALENLGVKNLTQQDAVEHQFEKPVDALVENPPFGTVRGPDGQNKEFPLFGTDQSTREIDQAIALRSLQSMTDDGRAVLILGGKNMTDPAARADAYLRQSDFWNELYGKYRVVDHFTINGDLYSKQGAGWPVDMVVIAGRGQSPIQLPSSAAPRILNSWDALKNEITRTDEERISAGKYDPERDRVQLSGALQGIRDVAASDSGPGSKGALRLPADERPASDGVAQGERVSDSGELPVSGGREGVPPSPEGESGRMGVGSDSGEPVQRGQQLTADFRVPYKPASTLGSLGIYIPRNMEAPVADYLSALKARVGDLDTFVRKNLGYGAKDPLGKYFSAEQIDAMASAIDADSRGDAMVIGHQGGVGKGRIAAGLIRYAMQKGLVPIFATKDEKLYAAMLNDLADIGSAHINPLFTNNKVDFEDKSGKQWKQGDVSKLMSAIAASGELPAEYHALFTSYAQIMSDIPKGFRATDSKTAAAARMARKNPPPDGPRMNALKRLMPKAFFILDESHLASGDSITGWRTLPLVMSAKGAYYSSATFAKRPDSMPIYGRTSIRRVTGNGDDLVTAMRDGGVPLQQVVSAMLARDGLYSRLERDFSGTRFTSMVNQATAERDIRIGDAYTGGLREILNISNKMTDAVKRLNEILRRNGKKMGVENAPRLESTNFSSKLHNLVSQYLTAIKAEAAVQRAHQLISKGDISSDGKVRKHKVIIALQNTMEKPIADLIASGKPLSFNGLLSHYLDSMRELKSGKGANAQIVTITDTPDPAYERYSDRELEGMMIVARDASLEGESVAGVDEGAVQELFRRIMSQVFTDAQAKIDKIDLEDMPISPIDYIRNKLEKLGVRTGEITGRGQGIGADGKPYERKASDYSKKAQIRAMSEFNNSDLDMLILNASGSTGISLHSSKDFKNTAPREMILLQPHLDINEFMQTLWRIDRTGQVHKPSYTTLQTALAAEKRPAAITLRKMASLNANTTSNAENEMTGAGATADIFNKYGDEVMHDFLRHNREFARTLGWTNILNGEGNLLPLEDIRQSLEDDGKLVAGVTGRAAIMADEEAKAMWDKVEADYAALISYLNELGQNDLLSDTLDIKAKTLSSETLTPAKAGTSAFDSESRMEKVEADTGAKPLTGAEAAKLRDESKPRHDEAVSKFEELSKAARADLEKTQRERNPETWPDRKPALHARVQLQVDAISQCLAMIGEGVRLENGRGLDAYGVVSDVKLDPVNILVPSKQIFTVVINNTKKKIKLAASQLQTDAKFTDQSAFARTWDATAQTSNIRHIVTGNLLAAYISMNRAGASGGNIANYTTADGSVRQGIMMPANYAGGVAIAQREVIRDVHHARAALMDGKTLADAEGNVTLARDKSGGYELRVPASRQSGGKYWRNDRLLNSISRGEFSQRGQEMVGQVADLEKTLAALTDLNIPLYLPVSAPPLLGARPVGDDARKTIQARIDALETAAASRPLTRDETRELNELKDSLPRVVRNPETDAAAGAAAAGKGRPASATDTRAAKIATAKEAMPLVQKLVTASRAALTATVNHFTKLPEVSDYRAAKGQWLGAGGNEETGAKGLQRAAHEARMMAAAVKRAVPNPISRMAISRYIEADGDITTLENQEAASKPKFAPIYARAQNLSPEEKAIADTAKKFFDEIGERAQSLGILGDMLEGYVAHFVDQSSVPVNQRGAKIAQAVGDIATSRMRTRFDRAIRRVFANMFELEKEGYRLHSSDVAEVMAAYAQEMNSVVAARTFVKQLTELKASDGRPLAVTSGYARQLEGDEDEPHGPLMVKPFAKPEEARDYQPIDHPALRKFKWAARDADGKPIFVEGELLIHPEIHQDLSNTLGKSALNKVPMIRALSDIQREVKSVMLGWSLFHYVQEGTHAIGHGVNPFKLHKVDMNDPITRELVNAGLMLTNWDAKREFAEGLASTGGLLSKVPVLGKLNDELSGFLFQDYIPGLKIAMAKEAFHRNLDRFKKEISTGKITRAQVAQKTAQQSNDAFGEQNTRYAGENPTKLHAERMAFLAPDFLKSRIKFFADAFTKYGGEQRRALIILAVTMMVTAKLLERALTGKNDWKKPFAVVTPTREYELRSVPGDVLEAFQDPRRFVSGRLSPIISRTLLEAITGRDYRGMKRTGGEQLMDLIKTAIPMSVRGAVDAGAKALDPHLPKAAQGKLTTNSTDISGGEQVASAMGLRAKRHSDVTDARILGHEWRQKQGLESDDTVYPPSKYVGLKDALEDQNMNRARSEFRLLVEQNAGRANAQALAKGFRESMMRPFSGAEKTEKAFVASLDTADRATYNRAVQKRNQILSQFTQIAGPPHKAAAKAPLFTGFP